VKPAARAGDPTLCPLHDCGVIVGPGLGGVLVGGQPAARILDDVACIGGADVVMEGSTLVIMGNLPAARHDHITGHNGIVVGRAETVVIGGPTSAVTGDPKTAAAHFAGHQERKDTCAVASVLSIYNQKTGERWTEKRMQAVAAMAGDPNDPAYQQCRGTTSMAALLRAAGIPATDYLRPSLEDIARAVEEGRGVIVGLDARALWGMDVARYEPMGHAVRVTGVERDASGRIVAFYINDSGSAEAGRRVPADDVAAALSGLGGGRMATTDEPL
jgi:uncharacterized Zn-binding protein involved in type VI secretion